MESRVPHLVFDHHASILPLVVALALGCVNSGGAAEVVNYIALKIQVRKDTCVCFTFSQTWHLVEARLSVRLEAISSLASTVPLLFSKVREMCVMFGLVVFTVLEGKLPSEGDTDTWKRLGSYVS